MFLEVLDSHAPIRSKRVRKRPSLPWLSKDIRDKMLERDRLKRLAMIKKTMLVGQSTDLPEI